MATTTKYDTTEAAAMIQQLAGENDAAKRMAAADALRVIILDLLERAGRFYAEPHEREKAQLNLMRGNVLVGTLNFRDDGVHLRVQKDGEPLGKAELLKLRYDAATDRFIGTEEDTTRFPVPGETRKYRDAVTVIVDEFCKIARASIER